MLRPVGDVAEPQVVAVRLDRTGSPGSSRYGSAGCQWGCRKTTRSEALEEREAERQRRRDRGAEHDRVNDAAADDDAKTLEGDQVVDQPV
jgi:hypothetical protein